MNWKPSFIKWHFRFFFKVADCQARKPTISLSSLIRYKFNPLWICLMSSSWYLSSMMSAMLRRYFALADGVSRDQEGKAFCAAATASFTFYTGKGTVRIISSELSFEEGIHHSQRYPLNLSYLLSVEVTEYKYLQFGHRTFWIFPGINLTRVKFTQNVSV